ncbi:MAG TPA: hypothetical protein VIQ99_02250 [Gammaproteobacteria bacterium]
MSAVLRVFWLFYTAFPLQRWLAVTGVVLCSILIAGGFWLEAPDAVYLLVAATFTVLAAFPAVFAGAALFRALSAPRSHQLFPHFRARMLLATALLAASSILWFAAVLAVPALLEGRALPAAVLVYPFGFVTAVFIWVFLFSGDWRWGSAYLLLPLGVVMLLRTGPGSTDADTLPLWPVATVASLAWAAFGVWYSRVRLVRPLMLTAAARREVRPWTDFPTRAGAIRAMLAWNGQPSLFRPFLVAVGGGGAIGIALLVLTVLMLPKLGRMPFLTSFIWPFCCMAIAGAVAGRIVGQSRLLWLMVGGGRDDIRRLIERAAWRNGVAALAVTMTTALIVIVPLGPSAREVALGLAVCASAAIYGVYVALSAVPGIKTQLVGFGLMSVAQLALIARADPAVASVAIIVAAQLLGAALFRALAVRRWRRIDWRLVQPIRGMVGVP